MISLHLQSTTTDAAKGEYLSVRETPKESFNQAITDESSEARMAVSDSLWLSYLNNESVCVDCVNR